MKFRKSRPDVEPPVRHVKVTLAIAFALLAFARSAWSGDIGTLLNNVTRRNLKTVSVAQLVQLRNDKKSNVIVFDADPAGHRAANGVIPGALVLTSSNHYDPAIELPKDKRSKLVFYCYTWW